MLSRKMEALDEHHYKFAEGSRFNPQKAEPFAFVFDP